MSDGEVGYCSISGHYFTRVRPGVRCPIHPLAHDLESLPDAGHTEDDDD